MLKTVMRFLENAENGGELEQWQFLNKLLRDSKALLPETTPTLIEYLQSLGILEHWQRITLGANIAAQIRQCLNPALSDPDHLAKLQEMLMSMELTGIHSERVPSIREFIALHVKPSDVDFVNKIND